MDKITFNEFKGASDKVRRIQVSVLLYDSWIPYPYKERDWRRIRKDILKSNPISSQDYLNAIRA